MTPTYPWPGDVSDVVAVRRDLHAHPEVGFTEIRTAARVATVLEAMGLRVRSGPEVADVAGLAGLPPFLELDAAVKRALAEGVPAESVARFSGGATAMVVVVEGNRPGPAVGLRVDMDALPVIESTDATHPPQQGGWGSRNPGQMHACGHDGHVAIALGLAARLIDRDFPGSLTLLFQPAEEGVRGAAPMIAAGALQGLDCLLALHLGFGLPSGALALRTSGLVGTTKYRARLTGVAAHAANAPERGRNALLAAAAATLSLHTLAGSSAPGARVNVGRLEAGSATNIVAAHAELAFETRARTAADLADLDQRALAVLEGAATAHGVSVRHEVTGSAVPAHTDDWVAEAVREAASRLTGINDVRETAVLGASDDASLMMRAVQEVGGTAGYLLLGSTGPGAHHAADFDIDEGVLALGVDLLEALVRRGHLGTQS